jgi:lactate dehydrogenase-like 2-hydroxyacid dehydrogenase
MHYKKLVVLDSVMLTRDQWSRLHSMADSVETIRGGLTHTARKEIRKPQPLLRQQDEIFCGLQMTVPQHTAEEMIELLKAADGIVTCWTPIPNNVIAALKANGSPLRHIAAWTNFVEGRVDMEFARQQGIHVSMIPGYGTEAVAQYVIGLMLFQLARCGSGAELQGPWIPGTRSIVSQMLAVQRGEWRFEQLKQDQLEVAVEDIVERTISPDYFLRCCGRSLEGYSLGIVGLGRIGSRLKQIAEALGMVVKYFSHSDSNASLEEVLATSKFVSLHLPPTGAQGLITPELIGLMQPGGLAGPNSMLINTSVGNVIADEHEMFRVARERRVALALDVYQLLPPLSEIKKTRRVDEKLIISTYRNGWFTRDALELKGELLLRNLESH